MDSQELQRLKNKFDIVGNNAGLNHALEMAVAVAPTDLTVLVCGESGVGKENIPKIIHQNSLRKMGKYFAVNCGAIPEGTIDSELFGHEKGSFTGAIEARKGYFEEANGGTLFLDEVGELPMASQAKLLRVLQSGEYIRVGSSKVNKTDVRVIAATNVDLLYAVSHGKFREDLYYRLNAIQITMPALRDRKDDIYLLFRKFAADFADKFKMDRVRLSNEAIAMLTNYRWPGNIRQLKNIAETVQTLESGRAFGGSQSVEISAASLSRYIPKDSPDSLPVRFSDPNKAISDDDKQKIYQALLTLSGEVQELKKTVAELQAGQPHQEQKSLPGDIDTTPSIVHRQPMQEEDNWAGSHNEPQVRTWAKSREQTWEHAQDIDIQDIDEHKEAQESLSIKGASDDLIRKALEKHNGNRKKAAEELGISERTLYRKMPPEYRKMGGPKS